MRFLLACVLFLISVWCMSLSAQTFPEKEGDEVIYYRLVSAYPEYAARLLCLQDVSKAKGAYNFILADYDATAKQQDWTFQTAADAGDMYNLRNRLTRRYISTATTWVEDYMTLAFDTKKVVTDALVFTPLGSGQYAISYESDGQTCYLAATDVSAAPSVLPKKKKDTPWAWYIYKAAKLESGIMETNALDEIVIVRNRRIIVVGASQWQLFDVQGRAYSPEETLASGIYLVKTARATKRVVVE